MSTDARDTGEGHHHGPVSLPQPSPAPPPTAPGLAALAAALESEASASRAFDFSLRDLLVAGQPHAGLAQGSAAWHAARAGRLTASAFGAAAGLSPHCTPRSLWQHLCGQVEGPLFEGNAHTARGEAGEPVALAAYSRLTGRAVRPAGLFVHRDHSWLAASPDGLLDGAGGGIGGGGVLEIKCPEYGVHRSVPPAYMAQVQGQMACSGARWGHFFSFSCGEAPPVAGAGGEGDGAPVAAALFFVPFSPEYWCASVRECARGEVLSQRHFVLLLLLSLLRHPQRYAPRAWLLERLSALWCLVQAGVEPAPGELPVPPSPPPPRVAVRLLRRWG